MDGGGLFRIDIAFHEEKVAIELDGPENFVETVDGARRPNGITEAKETLLRTLGWEVLHYDWKVDQEWQGLKKPERQEKWRKILDEHVKPKRNGWK